MIHTSTQRDQSLPTLSVGMPVYNAAAWIVPTMESILGQSFTNFELIISDNASTDETFAILQRYADQDPRIRLFRHERNVGANRNYLAVLDYARAPYFKWASSNDICADTFLAGCVMALERDKSAVLAFSRTSLFENDVSDATPYDRDVELLSDSRAERFIDLFRTMGLNNAFNGVARRDALLKARPLGNYQRADIVLMAELALMGKFLLIDEQLFFRRMSRAASTKLQNAKQVDQHLEPQAVRPLQWQNWIFYSALLRATLRHTRFTGDSFKTLLHVTRQIRWAWRDLAKDVRYALTKTSW